MFRSQKQISKSYWIAGRRTPESPGQQSPGLHWSSMQIWELLYKDFFAFCFALFSQSQVTCVAEDTLELLMLPSAGTADPRVCSLLSAGEGTQGVIQSANSWAISSVSPTKSFEHRLCYSHPTKTMNHGEVRPLLDHTSRWPCQNSRQLSWFHLPAYFTGTPRVAKSHPLWGWEVSTPLSPFALCHWSFCLSHREPQPQVWSSWGSAHSVFSLSLRQAATTTPGRSNFS